MAKSQYSGASCRKASLRNLSLSLLSLPLLIATATSSSSGAEKLSKRNDTAIPLVIENLCKESIWPGIVSQAGTGAGTGGFELTPGTKKELSVSPSWQGRVWGRTNCSFNADGSSSANSGRACYSGDCGGVLNCVGTVSEIIPPKRAYANYDHRAKHPSHSLKLPLLAAQMVNTLTTTSLLWTVTTSPWELPTYLVTPPNSRRFHQTSPMPPASQRQVSLQTPLSTALTLCPTLRTSPTVTSGDGAHGPSKSALPPNLEMACTLTQMIISNVLFSTHALATAPKLTRLRTAARVLTTIPINAKEELSQLRRKRSAQMPTVLPTMIKLLLSSFLLEAAGKLHFAH